MEIPKQELKKGVAASILDLEHQVEIHKENIVKTGIVRGFIALSCRSLNNHHYSYRILVL